MTRRRAGRLRAVTGTIRFRVTALAALAVLLVLSAASTAVVLAHRSTLTDSLDEALAEQAGAVTELVRAGRHVDAAVPLSDDVAVQVVGPDGTVLAASPALAGQPPWDPPPEGGTPPATTADVDRGGGPVRLLSRTVDGTTVHVAGDLDDIQDSAAALTASLLVAVPISAAALAGVVWWSVGRALRPVEDIRAQVDQISGTRLDRRVPEPATHDEVARLAHTMNAMLDRLHASAQQQRRFVADASHELRSPLARIRSELEVDLAHPASADPPATHRSVLAETATLQQLLDDLLLLARGDAAAPQAPREPVDLDHLLTQQSRRLQAGTSLRVDAGHVAPVQVHGDRSQLQRAVANLLDNAARHARTSITLTLTQTPDRQAVLTVADDGPGIPPDQADVVFQRFTRLDAARHSAHGGAGLGLAIARDIAERHDGTLTLDPHHHPGARFVLTLPTRPS